MYRLLAHVLTTLRLAADRRAATASVAAWGAALLLGTLVWSGGPTQAAAQQKVGYIESEYILDQLPEYATVQQKLDRLEEQWRSEIETARQEVETLQEEFQARELLYTEEERTRKQKAIQAAKDRVQELRQRYFGPDGELYSRQQELMRPIQERVLTAVEEVATGEGYDYVFDKSGDYLFMFTREQYNLSDAVLREMGVNVDRQQQDPAAQQTAPPPGQTDPRRDPSQSGDPSGSTGGGLLDGGLRLDGS